jgi:hypothetical protein
MPMELSDPRAPAAQGRRITMRNFRMIVALAAASFACANAGGAAAKARAYVEEFRLNFQDAAEAAHAATQPLPEGQFKVLEAVVMATSGRAEWRADEKSAWKAAAMDDLLRPGAMIRTGKQSLLTLRVGKNITLLVDSLTRATLPEIVQDGQVLRTRAGVERGRVDAKVDHIGLINDVAIVTPSTTLAVRGTGFAVRYGGLEGTQIAASRFNFMSRVEVHYFATRLTYQLTRQAVSSDKIQDPAVAALFDTIGPPPIVTALVESGEAAEVLAQGGVKFTDVIEQRSIAFSEQAVEEIAQETNETIEEIQAQQPPESPTSQPFEPQFIFAQYVCDNLEAIFLESTPNMQQRLTSLQLLAGTADVALLNDYLTTALEDCFVNLENFEGDPLLGLVASIQSFCDSLDGTNDQTDVDLCVASFFEAIADFAAQNGGFPPGSFEPPGGDGDGDGTGAPG